LHSRTNFPAYDYVIIASYLAIQGSRFYLTHGVWSCTVHEGKPSVTWNVAQSSSSGKQPYMMTFLSRGV